jgi:hypothetical protein
MKKYLFAFLFLMSSCVLLAQTNSYKGFFVNINGGMAYNNSHKIRTELNALYGLDKKNFFDNTSFGYSAGIGGMIIVNGNILVGASANYAIITDQSENHINIKLNSVSGFLNAGALLYNKNKLIIYDYIGIGYGKYFMEFTNSSDFIYVDYDYESPVEPNTSQKYTSDYPLFELGIGFKRPLNDKFMLGINLGTYFSPCRKPLWNNDGHTIKHRNAPSMEGGYIKLILEFGNISEK